MDIADLDFPPVEKMSRRKKWCIAGILVAIFGVLLFFYLRDDELQDDSDLTAALPELAEEDNGLRFFDGLMEKYEADFDSDDFGKLKDMLSDDDDAPAWDAAFAMAQVERFLPLLEALESAAQAPGIRARAQRTMRDSYDVRLTALHQSVTIARALARLALESARPEDTYRLVGRVLEAGGKVIESPQSLVALLIGSNIFTMGLTMTEDLVTDEKRPLDTETNQLIRQAVGLLPTLETGVSHAYDGEYQITRDTFLQITDAAALRSLAGNKLPVFLFKKNRTVNRLADQFRQLKSSAGKTYADIDSSTPPLVKPSIAKLALSGNAVGEVLLQMISAFELTQGRVIPSRSRVEILQVIAALRHYHTDNGQLPETLEALVPKYLAAIPVDRYNGSSLHYDKKRAVVWCVGKNLTDDGAPDGEAFEPFGKMDDPAIRLPWLAD